MVQVTKYNKYIESIRDFLIDCGVSVSLQWDLPDGMAGGYRFIDNSIFINRELLFDSKEILLTLAHEGGHWMGYLIEHKKYSYQRERQAFAYGWHILEMLDCPISRAEWIQAEHDRREDVRLNRELEGDDE